MKEKILKILYEKNDFVSGEYLSNELQISRTAVWKNINELRNKGYIIQAITNKGYKLLSSPDLLSEAKINISLQSSINNYNINVFDTLESTQIKAHEYARKGAKHNTVILAERQLKGRGRLGRVWYSDNNSGVWMSIILRPKFPLAQAAQITLAISLSLIKVFVNNFSLPVMIKWPNDIYIGQKKLAGILTELKGESDHIEYIILGIGINVNTKLEEFSEEIRGKATSMFLELNRFIDRNFLIAQILTEINQDFMLYETNYFSPFITEWEKYSMLKGKNIIVKNVTDKVKGKVIGINNAGNLLILDNEQNIIPIFAGEILLENYEE